MSNVVWTQIASAKIPAEPDGVWTLAAEWIESPCLLKIVATGKWHYRESPGDTEDSSCGPDGEQSALVPEAARIAPAVPAGAIIGKLGGSTTDGDGAAPFPVGTHCVMKVAPEQAGPLYLTINDSLAGLGDNRGELEVTISIAPPPASP